MRPITGATTPVPTVAGLREIESTVPENLEVLFADGGQLLAQGGVGERSGLFDRPLPHGEVVVNMQCDPPGEGECPESGAW